MSIRRFAPHEWQLYRDLRLRALNESPDAFGSTFAREAERTDDEWALRLSTGAVSLRDLPLIAEVGGEPTGLAWARIDEADPTLIHLFQVWVAPEQRQQGIGKALLDATLDWAQAMHAHRVALSVTCGDSPAFRLYLRAGFISAGEPQPLRPGATLCSQSMQLDLGSGFPKSSAKRSLKLTGD